MAKVKQIWCCTECGQKQQKWVGQCPTCNSWNSFQEEIETPQNQERYQRPQTARPVRLREVSTTEAARMTSGLSECDRLLGGGIVPGSLTLVGGDPGIGKSTLLLQLSNALASQGKKVLYICAEESVEQTSLRARRLNITSDNLLLFCESDFAHIQNQIKQIQPDLVIVDSIQIIYKAELPSAPGSVSQVREVATEFMHIAKGQGVSIFLIGHVTKSGEIAGPRVLEHLVDTVLYFEGDRQHNYRLIRVVKNRFGPTDEIGVFQMQPEGLTQVLNPSQLFLEQRQKEAIGSVVIPTIEGSRPILIEVQALVTQTVFSTPSRRAAGIDPNRLALLLAVLEKRLKFPLYQCDIFVAVAGGMRINEPASDLGMLLAIASSFRNQKVDADTVVMGEVGLSGEVRSIPRVESRIKEAIHLGFKRCLIPSSNLKGVSGQLKNQIEVEAIHLVEEAIHALV